MKTTTNYYNEIDEKVNSVYKIGDEFVQAQGEAFDSALGCMSEIMDESDEYMAAISEYACDDHFGKVSTDNYGTTTWKKI